MGVLERAYDTSDIYTDQDNLDPIVMDLEAVETDQDTQQTGGGGILGGAVDFGIGVMEQAVPGIARGSANVGATAGNVIRWAGDVTDVDVLKEAGKSVASFFEAEAKGWGKDRVSLKQAYEEPTARNIGRFLGGGVGEQVPTLLAIMSGAAAGTTAAGGVGATAAPGVAGAMGGAEIGSLGGALGASYGLELGSIYGDQPEDRKDPLRAAAFAAPAAMLDAIAEVRLLSMMPGMKNMLGSIAEHPFFMTRQGSNWFLRGLSEAKAQGGTEGTTEWVQTIFEQLGSFKDPTAPEQLWEQAEAATLGTLVGSVPGFVAGATDSQSKPVDVNLLEVSDILGGKFQPGSDFDPKGLPRDERGTEERNARAQELWEARRLAGASGKPLSEMWQTEQDTGLMGGQAIPTPGLEGIGREAPWVPSKSAAESANVFIDAGLLPIDDDQQQTPAPPAEQAPFKSAAESAAVFLQNPPQYKEPEEKDVMADYREARTTRGLMEGLAGAPTEIDVAAHEAATSPLNDLREPTDAEKKAGNYKKGHVKIAGLDISIENPQGSERSGIGEDGEEWSVESPAHYGYIRGTTGKDGDQIDVYVKGYVGPSESSRAFIVDQYDPKTGKFDEHKVILGAADQEEAQRIYNEGFSDWSGPTRGKFMREVSVGTFKKWLKYGDTTTPFWKQKKFWEQTPKKGEPSWDASQSQSLDQSDQNVGTYDEVPTVSPGEGQEEAIKPEPGSPASLLTDNHLVNDETMGEVKKRILEGNKGIREELGKILNARIEEEGDKGLQTFQDWMNPMKVGARINAELTKQGVPKEERSTRLRALMADYETKYKEVIGEYRERAESSQSPSTVATEETPLSGGVVDISPDVGVSPIGEKEVPDVKEEAGEETKETEAAGTDRDRREEEGQEEEVGDYGTRDNPNVPALASFLEGPISKGEITDRIKLRKAVKDRTGWDIDANHPVSKAIEEATELAIVRAASNVVFAQDEGTDPKVTFDKLLDLYRSQPNLATRTSTSMLQQAYSTPAPIAYLVSRLANVTRADVVYEPTAGNGMLLMEANPESTIANELNESRADNLEALGFEYVEREDATTHDPGVDADVVLANPPFGKVLDAKGQRQYWPINDQYNTPKVDHAIAIQALKRMKKDGRAVLILGSDMGLSEGARKVHYSSQDNRAFFKTLFDNYNVTDMFTVDGKLYSRQGASWPIDIIVIDGKGKSDRALPAVELPPVLKTWDEVKEKLNERAAQDQDVSPVGDVSGGDRSPDAYGEDQPTDIRGAAGPEDTAPGGSGGTGLGGGTTEPVPDRGTVSGDRGEEGTGGGDSGSGTVSTEPGETVREPKDDQDQGEPEVAGDTGRGGHAGELPGTTPLSKDRDVTTKSPDEISGEDLANIWDMLEAEQTQPKEPKATSAPRTPTTSAPKPKTLSEQGQKVKDATQKAIAGFGKINDILGERGSFSTQPIDPNNPEYRQVADVLSEVWRDWLAAGKEVVEFVKLAMKHLGNKGKAYFQYWAKNEMDSVREAWRKEQEQPKQEVKDEPKAVETGTQIRYEPTSKGNSLDVLAPKNIRDAMKRAMETLQENVGGDLDAYVMERLGYANVNDLYGKLGAEQIEAVAAAIYNIENGGAFVLGDQTGVGKGRVCAAILRYAHQIGKKAFFVTDKPNLYSDIIRDLNDIGSGDLKYFVTNSNLSGINAIPLPNDAVMTTGKQADAIRQMVETGRIDEDIVFTTYDQIQPVKRRDNVRTQLIQRFAPESIVVFDESHLAGGSGDLRSKMEKARRRGEEFLNRAILARNIATSAHGVMFSSATFAKRADVISLYGRTDIRHAAQTIEELEDIMKRGGIPMQQLVASMLTESIQYMRRERSFDGIPFDPVEIKVSHKVANHMADCLHDILIFSRETRHIIEEIAGTIISGEGGDIVDDNATGDRGAESTNFTSVMHNLITQSLLAIKAEQTAKMAIDLINKKDSEKPIIAVASTMGSFIGDYVDRFKVRQGDPIFANMADAYEKYLERCLEYTYHDANGVKQREKLPLEALPPEIQDMFRRIREMIKENGLLETLHASPIDAMRAALERAGLRVGEITGREHAIDYSNSFSPKYRVRSASERSKAQVVRTIEGFNNGDKSKHGKVDVIILNQSGATGLSIHASEKVADQRPRHMLVAQAEANIDTFMQILGRVNRTGQVVPPKYSLLMADIPAELRPGAVLTKKMASLNAQTTGSRTSEVTLDVPDFMNQIGDEVAYQYLRENPELLDELGMTVREDDDGNTDKSEIMRQFTGRVPVLPIQQQAEIYDALISAYNERLQHLEAMGMSPLEAKTHDFQAEFKEQHTVFEGSGTSPFAQPAYLSRATVRVLERPPSSDAVKKHLWDAVGLDENATDDDVLIKGEEDRMDRLGSFNDEMSQYAQDVLSKYDRNTDDGEQKYQEAFNRLNDQYRSMNDRLETFKTGDFVNVVSPNGFFYGVVLEVSRDPKKAKNPASPGSWSLKITTTGAPNPVSVPFSQFVDTEARREHETAIFINRNGRSLSGKPIMDVFDEAKSLRREDRWVITGNVFAGVGRLKQGKLIHFTTNDGQTVAGCLMPRDFDASNAIANLNVPFTAANQILQFIDETGGRAIAKTADGVMSMKWVVTRYVFEVPPAGNGRKYMMNRGLIGIAGRDFVNGKLYTEDRTTAERIVSHVMNEMGTGWIADNHKAEARKVIERSKGSEPRTVTLHGGIPFDVDALIALKDDIKAAIPKLVELGRSVYTAGARNFKAFQARMREILGRAYDSFKTAMLKVYAEAKRVYLDESGAVRIGRTGQSVADFALDVKDDILKAMAGGLAAIPKGMHNVVADITPDQIRSKISLLLTTPIFEAERNPGYVPAIANQHARQQEGFLTRGEMRRYKNEQNQDSTVNALHKEFKELSQADQGWVEKLLVEGDIEQKEYETLDDAKNNKHLRFVTQSAFDHYRKLRVYINSLLPKIRKMMLETRMEHVPDDMKDIVQALINRDPSVSVSEIQIEDAIWQWYMDVKRLKAVFPEFQSKPWFDELVNLMGYREPQLPHKGKSKKRRWLKAALLRDVLKDPWKLGEKGKISEATLSDPKRLKALQDAYKLIVKNQILWKRVQRAKVAVVQGRNDLRALRDKSGQIKGWIPRVRDDGQWHVRVFMADPSEPDKPPREVWMQMAGSKSGARRLRKQVMGNLKSYMPHNHSDDMQYFSRVEYTKRPSEAMYGDMAGDAATEEVLNKAIERAKAKGKIDFAVSDQLRDALLRETADIILARGAGRHQIARKRYLVEGYQTANLYRVLDNYVAGAAGYITKTRYAMRQLKVLSNAKDEDKQWIYEYFKDSIRNQGWMDRAGSTARSVAALWFLGMRASSAIINLTQNAFLGQAELSLHSKTSNATMMKAMKDVAQDIVARSNKSGRRGKNITASEAAAIDEALRKGLAYENIVGEMIGEDTGLTGPVARSLSNVTKFAMIPFQAAEQFNREAAFLAAYRTFVPAGFTPSASKPYHNEAFDKAVAFVSKTQFEPGFVNLPGWARKSAIGRSMYTLMSFQLNTLNWMYNRMTGGEGKHLKALARALGALAAIGGLAALPGGDELNRLLKKLFGKDYSLEFKTWARKQTESAGWIGQRAVDFVFHGLFSLGGINVSNAMAVRFPILSEWLAGETMTESVTGVMGGLVTKQVKAAEYASRGQYWKALESAAPEVISGGMRAYRLATEGVTTRGEKPVLDAEGKPVKYTAVQAGLRALGFQPLEQSKQMELRMAEKDIKSAWTEKRDVALMEIRKAWRGDGADKHARIKEIRQKFNDSLKESQANKLIPPITGETVSRAIRTRAPKRQKAWEAEYGSK